MAFTSNANFESSSEDSDWYLWLAQTLGADIGQGRLNLRGKVAKFASEDHNDSFSWRSNYSLPLVSSSNTDKALWIALFGMHFLNGAPATTESNFDHVGVDLGVEFTRDLGKADLAFGPYYQGKSYSNFDGRRDHTFAGYAELLYAIRSWKLIPSTELGYTTSSLSAYSRFHLSLGVRAEFSPGGAWSFSGEYLYLNSQFTSRTITQTTAISRGRGQVTYGSVETHEAHSFSQIEVAAIRQLSETWKITSGFKILSQNSKSGIEDYSSAEIFGSLASSY